MAIRAIIAGMLAVVLAITIVTQPDTVALWLVAGTCVVALVILEPMSAFLLLPFAVAFGSLVSISLLGVNIGPTDLLVGALSARWLIVHRHELPRIQPQSLKIPWRTASQR